MIKKILLYGLPCITRVKGQSMTPTLYDGKYYIHNPFCCKYKHGDIVIADVEGEHVVKRIIATGGEHVVIAQNGSVSVNGEWIDEPYILPQKSNGKSFNLIVPNGCYWVMGDNRGCSLDSRNFGAVEKWRIKGKIILKGAKQC